MKIKCTMCNVELKIDNDSLREVSSIIEKHKLKAEHYLDLLNLMNGKCLDSDEHSFIFDESFVKQIKDLIKDYKNNITIINNHVITNNELNKKLGELLLEIEEIKIKIKNNDERINSIKNKNKECIYHIVNETMYENIEIWNDIIT